MLYNSDFDDFENNPINGTFPADEGLTPQTSLDVSIPVIDDEIDEADNQYFVAHLMVVDAVNDTLIVIQRADSNCIIVDDDCGFDYLI